MTERMTLKTLLADYPVTHALHSGAVSSGLVDLDFAPYKVANRGFKPFVRDAAFDCGELAIATFLQAVDWGKPLKMLPATVLGRWQHHCLVYNTDRGTLGPRDLAGKRIGVRAYTQTTGMWVRGILASQYGVDLASLTWLTFEDAHVAEYSNPSNVILAPEDKTLNEMLLAGELDAALLGSDLPDDPRLKPVIADYPTAALDWYAQTRAVPVNHVVAVRADLSRDRPDVMRELYRMFKDSRQRVPVVDGIDLMPFGYAALRPSIELAVDYCLEQGLIRRRIAVEELFDEVALALD
jgi:4,5-dihydroxyphthalate decarboxylase